MQAMTDILTEPSSEATSSIPLPPAQAPAEATDAATSKTPNPNKNRYAAVAPVLEKLFELYPHLFGQRFLPLKLGIFQELLAAHPDTFKRDALKAALGVHTRSTRYLQSVAAGTKRHDLQGNPVDDVALEHIFLSITELYARQQSRSAEDLKPKLARQLLAAYQASGLSRQDYLLRLPALQEPVAAVLDEVMDQVDQQRARDAALIKAFDASGKTVEEFADALGMRANQVRATLSQRHRE
jgi:ProP effector